MRTRSTLPVLMALLTSLLLVLAFAGAAAAAETTLTSTLAGGSAEVPPGDPDGSGSASVTLDPAEGTLCYEITVESIAPATASHIHIGAPGEAGDVVVPLDTDGFEGSTEGCIEPMEDAQALQDIVDDPAAYYVNVHTADFPGGAVRGQLAAAAIPNTAVASPNVVTPLAALGLLWLMGASLFVLARRTSIR